jgi:hypothetical protein
MATAEQGHGPHSRYRVIAEFNLETEDGDCFPSEVSNETCQALQEQFQRALDDLGVIGAIAIYASVSVEHGSPQPSHPPVSA